MAWVTAIFSHFSEKPCVTRLCWVTWRNRKASSWLYKGLPPFRGKDSKACLKTQECLQALSKQQEEVIYGGRSQLSKHPCEEGLWPALKEKEG